MSGKLEFSFNSSKIGEFVLGKEVMTIGRKEDNDIRIENLAVSGHHAKLLTIFDDSFLEDLNSTNGTFVNGKSVDKHALKNGDIIVIGKHSLRYINDSKTNDPDFEKTVFIRRPAGTSQSEPVKAETPSLEAAIEFNSAPVIPAADKLSTAKLQILNGSSAGKELDLVKESTKLGKAGGQVVLINRRPDGHFIVSLDQGPDNISLRVNGEDIGSRTVKLQNHDVIELNKLKIEYFMTS